MQHHWSRDNTFIPVRREEETGYIEFIPVRREEEEGYIENNEIRWNTPSAKGKRAIY